MVLPESLEGSIICSNLSIVYDSTTLSYNSSVAGDEPVSNKVVELNIPILETIQYTPS